MSGGVTSPRGAEDGRVGPSGSLVELEPGRGASSQDWTEVANLEVVNAASGLCMDDPGDNASAGAVQMEVGTCSDAAEQQWTPPQAPDTAATETVFGSRMLVFTPSMSNTAVQGTVDAVFSYEQGNQFGNEGYGLMFDPGTQAVFANIGFYTSIMCLRLNPTSPLMGCSWSTTSSTR